MALTGRLWAVLLVASATGALAQVPPDIAAQNRTLGARIDVPAAIRTYAAVEERPPYREVRIRRDIAYGADPRYRLDVFAPRRPERRALPVVIFATGGDFTRRIDLPGGAPFYDNVVLWAAKHGLIGVNTDRRYFRGRPWQTGPEDMAAMIGWVHAHIRDYGGDPERIVFLGHAFGGTQLVSYLAHPQYWCCHGPGIAAAVILSAPLNLPPATSAPLTPGVVGVTGHAPHAAGANPLFDPRHSDLGGLSHITIPVFIGSAQLEGVQQQQSARVLQQQLCALGRCPTFREFADHNHLSVMFSFNTADRSVSGPVLRWIEARGAQSSGSAVSSTTRRSTKLVCTPVTPSIRVMRFSSSC